MKKTRAELMKDVDAQYYGFRDDDDGLLVRIFRHRLLRKVVLVFIVLTM